MENMIIEIDAELDRLEANDTPSNCYGCAVYADSELPVGVVRFTDGNGNDCYCLASELLANLQAITEFTPADEAEEGDECTGLWKAREVAQSCSLYLEECGLNSPYEPLVEVWRSDEESEQGCGVPAIYKFETNGGTRYASVMDNVNDHPTSSFLQNGIPFCETMEEAESYISE